MAHERSSRNTLYATHLLEILQRTALVLLLCTYPFNLLSLTGDIELLVNRTLDPELPQIVSPDHGYSENRTSKLRLEIIRPNPSDSLSAIRITSTFA